MKKRYIVPAFFLIEAESEDKAYEIAANASSACNNEYILGKDDVLFLDQELTIKELMPMVDEDGDEELPQSYQAYISKNS
jgi:hypothetical protein